MGNNKPTIAFMGTPEFAVPVLRGLVEAGYPVVGAFSQPDRPKGRGHKLAPTPVKLAAQELGVPVYQFERIRRPEGLAALADLAPELVVTAAFRPDPVPAAAGYPDPGLPECPRLAAARPPGGGPGAVEPDPGGPGDRGNHHAHGRGGGYRGYSLHPKHPHRAGGRCPIAAGAAGSDGGGAAAPGYRGVSIRRTDAPAPGARAGDPRAHADQGGRPLDTIGPPAAGRYATGCGVRCPGPAPIPYTRARC